MSEEQGLLTKASVPPSLVQCIRPFVAGIGVGLFVWASTALLTRSPTTPLLLADSSSIEGLAADNEKRLLLLNLDIGMGSVQVPWQRTVVGGTDPNASYSSSPALKLPKISCKKIVSREKLCDGCIPNDVDDSQVLAWVMNLMVNQDSRVRPIGISQTFGNADFASASHALQRLMKGKGWKLNKEGRWLTWETQNNGQTFRLNFPVGASAGAVIDFEAPVRKYVDVGGELVLLESHLAFAKESCMSSAVQHLHHHIMDAPRPVHLVATGPASDISCLLRNFGGPKLFSQIHAIYFLGGRRWGKGLHLCNKGNKKCLPGLSDFNVRKNPIAIDTLLKAGLPPEKLIFFPFELSGEYDTSMAVEDFVQHAAIDHCNTPARQFLMSNLVLRAGWYQRVLGFGERIWLWDLMPMYRAIEPSSMNCRQAKAAVIWCDSKPGYARYHGPSHSNERMNSCVDHSVIMDGSTKKPFPSMRGEAAQLWFCTEEDNCSKPDNVAQVPVTICDRWSNQEAKKNFMAEVLRYAFY